MLVAAVVEHSVIPTNRSIMDGSCDRAGNSHTQTLQDTVQFAQQAKAPGYQRFWVSEHYSAPGY
ncbi:hypothetical protein SAMN05661093_09917 [Kibdelosporangium aridum]|uniref:LLM class flavin-dependent oxidoreductase n=1 Tax=Kibdelosporangium aridum TaxID=2030 RepID=A0A1W2FX21_KIBAR|nr:hypothetical protein SAMN05661093_09917 [Kibdelosporangium aridum]